MLEDDHTEKARIKEAIKFFLMAIGIFAWGFLFQCLTGILEVKDSESFKAYLYSGSLVPFLFGLFFEGTSIFLIFWFIKTSITEHRGNKKTLLYLDNIEDKWAEFLDAKGKKYYYDIYGSKLKLEQYKYYYGFVHGEVLELIVEESSEKFEKSKIKRSYWLNLYSPTGNFEDMLLLPLIYFFFLVFLMITIISEGPGRLVGLYLLILPTYLLIYDSIYKIIQRNQSPELPVDDTNLQKSYKLIVLIYIAVPVILVSIILLKIIIDVSNIPVKVFFIIFLIVIYINVIYSVRKKYFKKK